MPAAAIAKKLRQSAQICAIHKNLAELKVARSQCALNGIAEDISRLRDGLEMLENAYLGSLQGGAFNLDLSSSWAMGITRQIGLLEESESVRADAMKQLEVYRNQHREATYRSDAIDAKAKQALRRALLRREECKLADLSDQLMQQGSPR